MTENKQIIIHSIDVSECEHITYKDSLNPMCGNTGICCYGRRDCYFKQLARKEQECEELRQTLTEIKEIAEWHITNADTEDVQEDIKQILQLISEVENES